MINDITVEQKKAWRKRTRLRGRRSCDDCKLLIRDDFSMSNCYTCRLYEIPDYCYHCGYPFSASEYRENGHHCTMCTEEAY